MISYFKELLTCLWEIEKDLHTIASSMKAKNYSEDKETQLLNSFQELYKHF